MPKKVKPVTIEGDVAYITLTKGYTAVIDAADVPLVGGYNWYAKVSKKNRTVYAQRNERKSDGKQKTILLHRAILNPKNGELVDHRDHDGLNNRRQNLRICDDNENKWNTKKRLDNTSGFKGVHWVERDSKWSARITVNGYRKHLGYFNSPEEAHVAYCEASEKYHNEFGHTG